MYSRIVTSYVFSVGDDRLPVAPIREIERPKSLRSLS
jgi:hypothetical protein